MRVVRFKISFIILTVLMCAASVGLPSQAKERRKVTVLFPAEEDSLLYGVNDDGTPTGMMSEYFDALEKCTGWDMEYVTGDMDELYAKFLAGEIDIMGTAAYTEELVPYVDYPLIASGANYTALAAKDDTKDIVTGDITSINNKTVAVTQRQQQSGKVDELLAFCNENGALVNIKVYDSHQEYYTAVENGEADLMMVGSMAIPSNLREILCFGEQPYYTVVSKGREEILNELNTALYTMHRMTADYGNTLYRKYFSMESMDLAFAFTEEEKKYLSEKKTLKAAVTRQFTGKQKIDGQTEYSGFMIDVAQRFGEYIGVDIEFVLVDGQAGAQKALAEGEADFAPAFLTLQGNTSPEKITLIPYTNVKKVMVANLEDETEDRILAATGAELEGINKGGIALGGYDEVLPCNSLEDCIDQVYEGKADATYMDMFSAQYYVITKGYSNLTVLLNGENCGELNIGVAKNCDAELLTIMEKVKMYTDEDEISQVILQNVINQKSQITVKDFFRQHMAAIIIVACVALCFIISCIYWVIYSRMKRRSAEAAVREREENEKRLSIALTKANAATVAKSRFLSNVSHEMRTPLNGIMGMLTLLESDEMSEQAGEHLNQAQIAAEHLMTLVSDVLDMSKIETNESRLNKEIFDIHSLLEQTQAILQMRLKEKKIRLDIKDESPVQKIWGDAPKVRQILLNIVGNSIKFLQVEGIIGIEVRRLPDRGDRKLWYEFVCWDNGPGISDEYMEHIFQPFTRAKEAEENQIRGTGLGLSIVKGLVDLFGGTIEVAGTEGVCFHIQLPFEEIPENIQPKVDKSPSLTLGKEENTAAGKHVLVAEDNELNLQIMVEFLKILEVTAESARDGEEAVKKYVEHPAGYYDAILMDIQMPKCNGYMAAELIRKSQKEDAQTIPIIATTANAFTEDIEKSKAAGMNGHLAKPLNIEMLKKVLS